MSEYEGKYPTDFLGNRIAIGTAVVYPTRRGSDMHLNKGTVKDINYRAYGDPWFLTLVVETTEGVKPVKRIALHVPAHRCVVA